MEETKTIEYIIGALGLLSFIGLGVLLGYLWNELRWRTKEHKKNVEQIVEDHQVSMKKLYGYGREKKE